MVEQLEFTSHWMKLIRFVGQMAIVAARELAGLPTEDCLQEIEAPSAINLGAENLQTKRGTIDARSFRKELRTQTSDGVQNPSAVIVVSFRNKLPCIDSLLLPNPFLFLIEFFMHVCAAICVQTWSLSAPDLPRAS